MTDVATRLKKHLEGDSSIANEVARRVHYGNVPPTDNPPFIWIRRQNTSPNPTLDSSAGESPEEFAFEIESWAATERDMQSLAEYVRARCHCYRGAFDDSTVRGMFVTSQDESFEPNGAGSAEGLHVCRQELQVFV